MPVDGESILIVEGDQAFRSLLTQLLEQSGYRVHAISRGDEAIPALEKDPPTLALLNWKLPGLSGLEVCRAIRAHRRLRGLPVILLTERDELEDRLAGIETGVDDTMLQPYNDRELLARIRSAIRVRRRSLDANPLTGLPGNLAIYEELERRIKDNAPLAVAYLDIDNFKVYNDLYGFEKGDVTIRTLAEITCDSVEDFVGHIGGDDFVYFSIPSRIAAEAQRIIKRFTAALERLYSREDLKQGSITAEDRRGDVVDFPLMSVTIVGITNEELKITRPAEVSKIVAELKSYGKSKPGSNYIQERRSGIFRIKRDIASKRKKSR